MSSPEIKVSYLNININIMALQVLRASLGQTPVGAAASTTDGYSSGGSAEQISQALQLVSDIESELGQMIDATIKALAGSSGAFMRTDDALGNLLDG
ncbi:MAG: hypothetical protein LBG68_04185 [Coriobacteriales bacterium]|jgi:hypothetical protein|nr:hypothetical protein [Coriobacteriales bacterium]